MEHVYWVIEGALAGRPGATREPWNPEALYAGGLRTVVSLAREVEVEELTTFGLRHHRTPFPPLLLGSEGLQKAFIYQALPVWRFIHGELEAGRPTLVHCHAGQDRTGAVLAGYLVLYKIWTPAVAIAHVRDRNPLALSAEGYEEAVHRLEPGRLPDPRTLL